MSNPVDADGDQLPLGSATRDKSATCGVSPRRATKVDIERRRARIGELLGRGMSGDAIVRRISAEDGIGERQARIDVAAVRDAWAAALATEEPHRRVQLLALLDAVAAAAFEDRAWGACVAAARELARVCGLDAPVGVNVTAGHDPLAPGPAELHHAALVLLMTTAQRLAERDRLEAEISKVDSPSTRTELVAMIGSAKPNPNPNCEETDDDDEDEDDEDDDDEDDDEQDADEQDADDAD